VIIRGAKPPNPPGFPLVLETTEEDNIYFKTLFDIANEIKSLKNIADTVTLKHLKGYQLKKFTFG